MDFTQEGKARIHISHWLLSVTVQLISSFSCLFLSENDLLPLPILKLILHLSFLRVNIYSPTFTITKKVKKL